VVGHLPQKKPIPNYTDISVEGSLPEVVNNYTMEFALELAHDTGLLGGTDSGSTVVKFCATNLKVAGSIPDGVIGFFS
jgi:hypothetical protein